MNRHTSAVELELWRAVTTPAENNQNAEEAVTLMGRKDVLNSLGYTQPLGGSELRPPPGADVDRKAVVAAGPHTSAAVREVHDRGHR